MARNTYEQAYKDAERRSHDNNGADYAVVSKFGLYAATRGKDVKRDQSEGWKLVCIVIRCGCRPFEAVNNSGTTVQRGLPPLSPTGKCQGCNKLRAAT